jgi:lipopolysaccharide export system protein LptA
VCGVAVVELVAVVAGQSRSTRTRSRRLVYAPATDVSANDIRHDEATHTTYARGQVRIVSESSTIMADEADLHHVKDTRTAVDMAIDLRGNVRVLVTPSAAK